MKLIKYHRGKLRTILRNSLVYVASYILGQKLKVHRIPFGPIKGRKIYTTFAIGPRTYFGLNELCLAKLAKELIKPGDVVYDIGAHIGYTVLIFAQNTGDTGAVHAFEILPSTVELLKKTVDANEFNNIVVHDVGFGLKAQTIELVTGATAMTDIYSTSQGNEKTELCKIASLDQYVKEHSLAAPALIKIDVEGAEIDCLHGGNELINKHKPIMLIEFHDLKLLKEGYDLLKSWGYSLTAEDKTPIEPKYMETLKDFHETALCLPS